MFFLHFIFTTDQHMTPFHKTLSIWFQQNRRDLPWRHNNNPYLVWISEIILQQTRVEQGLPWYLRFIERFPDIKTLAEASEEDVLLVWQGLGYYTRARNLHKAARQIMLQFNGEFPGFFDQIRNLKGVGDYTASAIASISFGLPHAVLDGNVFRVLARIFGVFTPIDTTQGKKEFARLADSLLDKKNPGAYNEALMDFGALQCKPLNPICSECPFESQCYALKNHQIEYLPVKSKKTAQRNRYFNYLLIRYNEQFYLQKRKEDDIWKNLYQLPLIETELDLKETEVLSSSRFKEILKNSTPVIECISPGIIHQLSHQKLFIRFINIRLDQPVSLNEYSLVPVGQLFSFPFPKPLNEYLLKELNKTI